MSHTTMKQLTYFLLLCYVIGSTQGLQLRNDTVSVSGISGGGFMAVQYHFAYSASLKGAGIIAGGPFACAQGSLAGATACMYTPSAINLGALYFEAKSAEANGLIDPIDNLKSQTVLLFSGTEDSVVNPLTMQLLLQMYNSPSYVGLSNITAIFNISAEHAWITSEYGNNCSYLGAPFINNCGIDFSGQLLSSILTRQQITWNSTKGTERTASLYRFDQTTFGASPLLNSLGTDGFVYIPERCQEGGMTCHLHVNFHGCKQGYDYTGSTVYPLQTQLNEWAESNDIVVLYPQATPNDLKSNPYGCFDWWGYNGDAYTTKQGAQMSAVQKMQTALLSGQSLPPAVGPTNSPKPTAAPNSKCANMQWGWSCVGTTSYINCPTGFEGTCLPGFICEGIPGFAVCI